jgi:hypothetical protein
MTLSKGQKAAAVFIVGGLVGLLGYYVVEPAIKKPIEKAVSKAVGAL